MAERYNQINLHMDYTYQYCTDSGNYDNVCHVCGNKIRYIHHIRHHSGVNLRVGCVCAANLTNDYDAPHAAERKVKPPLATQMNNWIRTGWKTARLGGYYRRQQKMVIILKSYRSGHSYLIKELDDDKCSINEHRGHSYETMEDAKIAAYFKKKEILGRRKVGTED